MNRNDQFKHNLLVNVARLYYVHNLTHQEIADKLNMSRVKVTRLLQEVIESKIVEFRIQDPIIGTLDLQDELEKKYYLKQAIITPNPETDEDLYDVLGHYAATYVMESLKDNAVVGIGFGRTMNGMLPYLKPVACENVEIVSLTGGLAVNKGQPNPYDIASAAASKLGVTAQYMLAPAIAESPHAKELFLRDKTAQVTMALWERLDICVMSIGLISPKTGVFYSFNNPQAEVEKVKNLGGVGDLLIRPFDIDGHFIQTDFIERTIAIDLDKIRMTPLVIGVAGGNDKFKAILGALRSGCVNVLITDELSAQKLVAF